MTSNLCTKAVASPESPLFLQRFERILITLYAISLPLSMTLSWAVLISGIVVSLVQFVCGIKSGERPESLLNPIFKAPLSLPLAAFTMAVMVSGVCNGGVAEGFASILSLKPLVVYLWAYPVLSRNRDLTATAIQCLLVTGSCAGLWGTVQQLTGFHPGGYPYLQGTGFFGGPMAFAGQMQILSLLALGIFLGQGNKGFFPWLNRPRTFALVLAANCLGAFFASERSAWLGVIAGALVVAGLWSWRSLVKSLVVLTVIFTISWTCVPVVQQRLAPLTNWQNDISVRVRFFLWNESIKRWKDSPYVGIGIRRFPHFDIPEAIVPGRSTDINHAHSNYLQILTTTGILGSAAYLWLCCAALLTALKSYRFPVGSGAGKQCELALSLGILGGIVALMVSGIFEYNFGTAQVRLLQWFVLSMLQRTDS